MQFNDALECAFRGENNPEALTFLENFEKQNNFTLFCLEKALDANSSHYLQFWCLQKLQQKLSRNEINDAECENIRTTILQWLDTTYSSRTNLEVHTKNKIAVILVLCFWKDYLTRWISAIRDIVALGSKDVTLYDFFLRFLMRLHDEILNEDSIVEQDIVRTIRTRLKESGDMAAIIEMWYKGLHGKEIEKRGPNDTPSWQANILECMSLCQYWCEFELLNNQTIFNSIIPYLQQDHDHLACIYAANYIQFFIRKPDLYPNVKLEAIQNLNMIPIIKDVLSKPGTLVIKEHRVEVLNNLCMTLLDCVMGLKSSPESIALWSEMDKPGGILESLWSNYNENCEMEMIDSVEPFISSLAQKLSSLRNHCDTNQLALKIFSLTYRNMAYPNWFDSDQLEIEEERHVTFVKLRSVLNTIIVRCVKFYLDGTSQELRKMLIHASEGKCSSALTESILVTLDIVAKQVNIREVIKQPSILRECFEILLQSDIPVMHQNSWTVQVAVIELYVRFNPYFQTKVSDADVTKQFIPKVMDHFVRLISRCQDRRLVAPACHYMLRFTKQSRIQVASLAEPLAEGLHPILLRGGVLPGTILQKADLGFVYESLGMLSSHQNDPGAYMKAILGSVAAFGKTLEAVPKDQIENKLDVFGEYVALMAHCVASFSKEISDKLRPYASAWEEVIVVILNLAILLQGRSEVVRDDCTFLCRRMVAVLKDDFLDVLEQFLIPLYHPYIVEGSLQADTEKNVTKQLQPTVWKELYSLSTLAVIELDDSRSFLNKQFEGPFPEAVRIFTETLNGQETSTEILRECSELQDSLLKFLIQASKNQKKYMANLLCTPVETRAAPLSFLLESLNGHNLVNCWQAIDVISIVALVVNQVDAMITSFPVRQLLNKAFEQLEFVDTDNASSIKISLSLANVLRNFCDVRALSKGVGETVLEQIGSIVTAKLPSKSANLILEIIEQGGTANNIKETIYTGMKDLQNHKRGIMGN